MKTRIISGIFIAAILVPCLIFGSYYLFALAMFLMVCATFELLNLKKQNGGKYPLYYKIITYLLMALLTLGLPFTCFKYSFDYQTFTYSSFGLELVFALLTIFVNFAISIFDSRVSLKDSLILSLFEILVSLTLKALVILRSQTEFGLGLISYVLVATIATDIFAYFGGMACYKLLPRIHKLNERISPKKTIEGALIGTLFGSCSALIFIFFVNPYLSNKLPIYLIIIMSILLSLVSQIGDLTFSLLKREYDVKDYSKLIPGHGGILDRIDSLSFVLILSASILALFGVL